MKPKANRSESFIEVPGFEEYLVSNDGNVFSKHLQGLISPWILRNGYIQVHLRDKNHKRKAFTIHRLVMLAFVGESTMQVNHKNGIKTDNRIENLEYCSPGENQFHAYKNGLKKGPTYWKGKFGKNASRSRAIVGTCIINGKEIRFDSIRLALKYFGRETGTISIALNGRTKKAYGFTWKYE